MSPEENLQKLKSLREERRQRTDYQLARLDALNKALAKAENLTFLVNLGTGAVFTGALVVAWSNLNAKMLVLIMAGTVAFWFAASVAVNLFWRRPLTKRIDKEFPPLPPK